MAQNLASAAVVIDILRVNVISRTIVYYVGHQEKGDIYFLQRRPCDSFQVNIITFRKAKLEDLKVLRRSPDLLNNVKIGQGQL